MEVLNSFCNDNHEFGVVVIQLRHVGSFPSFDITYT